MHKINPRKLMIAGYAISVCLIFQSLIAYVMEKKTEIPWEKRISSRSGHRYSKTKIAAMLHQCADAALF